MSESVRDTDMCKKKKIKHNLHILNGRKHGRLLINRSLLKSCHYTFDFIEHIALSQYTTPSDTIINFISVQKASQRANEVPFLCICTNGIRRMTCFTEEKTAI